MFSASTRASDEHVVGAKAKLMKSKSLHTEWESRRTHELLRPCVRLRARRPGCKPLALGGIRIQHRGYDLEAGQCGLQGDDLNEQSFVVAFIIQSESL